MKKNQSLFRFALLSCWFVLMTMAPLFSCTVSHELSNAGGENEVEEIQKRVFKKFQRMLKIVEIQYDGSGQAVQKTVTFYDRSKTENPYGEPVVQTKTIRYESGKRIEKKTETYYIGWSRYGQVINY